MITFPFKWALSLGALLLSLPAMAGTSMHGYSQEEAKAFQAELLYLKELGTDRSGILALPGLPGDGEAILRKIDRSIDGIIHPDTKIKGCRISAQPHRHFPKCSEPFQNWPTVNPPAIASLVNHIKILDVGLLSRQKHQGKLQAGPSKASARNRNSTYLRVDHQKVAKDFVFDTPQAISITKSFGILTAIRMKDIVDSNGFLPVACDYGIGLCDRYQNGPMVQGGAFLIYAANQCGQCSEKDRAKLFSLGLKVLSGAPGDSPIDPIELSEKFKGMVLVGIYPDSLKKEVRMKQLMHRGISPLL